MKQIFLCAINNILSGTCNKFCTQSVRYHADIERYSYKAIDQIVSEAKEARANGALGYCLVTAGKGLDDKKVDFVARTAEAIKAEVEGLNLIACNGTANKEQLRYLKEHGIDSYNHNLETSERYYPQICQTHGWGGENGMRRVKMSSLSVWHSVAEGSSVWERRHKIEMIS